MDFSSSFIKIFRTKCFAPFMFIVLAPNSSILQPKSSHFQVEGEPQIRWKHSHDDTHSIKIIITMMMESETKLYGEIWISEQFFSLFRHLFTERKMLIFESPKQTQHNTTWPMNRWGWGSVLSYNGMDTKCAAAAVDGTWKPIIGKVASDIIIIFMLL